MITDWLSHWISLGFGLGLLYLPHLCFRESLASRLMAGCVLSLTVIQAHVLLTVLGWQSMPIFLLHEAALYCVVPLLFLCVESLLGMNVTGRHIALHLSPVTGISLIALLQIIKPELEMTLQKGVYGISFAAGSAYALLVLKRLGRFAHPTSLVRAEAILLTLVVITGLGAALLVMIGVVFEQPWFYLAYGSAITALMVLGHLLQLRYPELAQVVSDELREAAAVEGLQQEANRRSQLAGTNIQDKLACLQQQMEQEHLYRQEDLNLAQLASVIGLSSHQLSELINEHKGINFSRFLKQYRIGEARQLLIERPSMSVLEIGMATGFNSLSAFYTAFREIEGMAPGMYRKQHHRIDKIT